MTDTQIVYRLLLATLLSGVIGFERERHGRAAGLRTHLLVCVGSTLLMLTSLALTAGGGGDPTRIAGQIVSGIGFLGAGTILRFRASVRGLTTAASLWAVAGLGIAIGSGFYVGAFAATGLILIALYLLPRFEERWLRRDWYQTLMVECVETVEFLSAVRTLLSEYSAEVKDFEVRRLEGADRVVVELNLKLPTKEHNDRILAELVRLPGVGRAAWR